MLLAARVPTVLRAAVWVLVAVLAAACVVTTGSSGDGGGATPDDGVGENPIGQVNRSELAEDERTAVEVTDRFWRTAFRDEFGRSYRSPRVSGGYTGENGPTCSGQPSVPFNAFYCPSQDFLAWDENLMATGFRRIGDAWVYLIIAHEWAHAIQARLERDRVSVAAELQADCLAGASLFGAARQGLVQIEPGDIEELQQTLVAVADDTPWTNEQSHGDARERTSSFSRGADSGVSACLPS
jgi:predicted metalloprotease